VHDAARKQRDEFTAVNVVRRGGFVTVTVPRAGRGWLVLASLAGSIGLAAASLFSAFPHWARVGGMLIAGTALLLLVWRILPPRMLTFDTRKGVVLEGGQAVARLADVVCVQLTQRGIGEEALYLVELRLAGGELLFLGYTKEEIDASSAAAQISGAVGRPVEVVAG